MLLTALATLALSVSDGDSMVEPNGGHARVVAMLDEVRKQCDANNIYLGWGPVQQLRLQLTKLPAAAPPLTRSRLQVRLGTELLRMGETEEAIQTLQGATSGYEALYAERTNLNREERAEIGDVWVQLGAAFLRLAEDRNCCLKTNPDSCIFPIQGGGLHTDKEGSTRAVQAFAQALRWVKPNSQVGRKARWLLNIAGMMLGMDMDDLRDELRIPLETFESDEPFQRFDDVATDVGLEAAGLAGGLVAEDFNGDGILDLMTSDSGASGPLRLFLGTPRGQYVERTEGAGLAGLLGGLNLVTADYDNDGDVDVLVLRGAWLRHQGRHINSLLRNEGEGRFVDMTFEAGLGLSRWPTQTAAFADYDLDGDLDLYVGTESESTQPAPNELYRNNGNGTFTEVASAAGVLNTRYTKGVAWGDIDGDGDPDLYVSNMAAPNRLYLNEGDGTFSDVAQERNVTAPISGFPCWFFDYDNDGALDLFAASYGGPGRPPTLSDVAGSYLGLPNKGERFCLYKGDGKGGFREVAQAAGLDKSWLPMGSNYGDADNDGFLDIYLGTGYPFYEGLMPNVMLRNSGGKRFADVTTAAGMGHLQKGHGVAFADLDGDGDQDVAVRMGGAYPGDAYRCVLFRNPGNQNHWLKVQLLGETSNHFGIGARIRVDLARGDDRRSVFRTVSTGGSFGCNPMLQEIGLGTAERIVRLEVWWPASQQRQIYEGIELDSSVVLREGVRGVETRTVRQVPFGTGGG